MAFSSKEGKESQDTSRQQDRHTGGSLAGPALPNSLMSEILGSERFPYSTINREMLPPSNQSPAAEMEADRLSAGVRGSKPEEVRREMGERLDADLSGIRFHSNVNSEMQGQRMGARAWTSGRDVYFGKGGYDPTIAAHELVHTVQQGAAKGDVAVHAPSGMVQMWSFWKKSAPVDMTSYDTADYLFKMEAGMSANRGRREATKNAAYARKYNSQKENGRSEQESRDAAKKEADRTEYEGLSLLTRNEKNSYENKIREMTYEEYDEVMTRWEDEAVALYDDRENLGETEDPGALDLKAVNLASGRNYRLYKSIADKMERLIPAEKLKRWKKQRAKEETDPERALKISDAADIFERGTNPSHNIYMTSAEGVRSMDKAGIETDDYYKKVFRGKAGPKKKTRIDKLAADYRAILNSQKKKKKNNKTLNDYLRDPSAADLDDQSSENQDKEDELIDKSSGEKSFEDEPENNIIMTSMPGGKKNDSFDLIGNESLDKSIASAGSNLGGMKENNLLDKSIDLLDNASIGENLINKNPADDQNQIIRNRGSVDADLAASFAPGNKNIANVKEANSHIGIYKSLATDAAQVSNLAHSGIIEESFGTGAGGMGLVSGALGVASGIHDIYRNSKNVAAGGEKMDVAASVIDTVTSGSAMVSGGISALNSLSKIPALAGALSSVSQLGGPSLIPGLNIVTGAGSAVTGGMQFFRGRNNLKSINAQIAALEGRKALNNDGKLSDDQQKLLNAFKQGKRMAEYKRTTGALKAISGGFTMGTGIATLFGPLAPAVGLGLGLASIGTSIGKFVYEKVKKYYLRKDITAEEMGINWDEEIKKVRAMFPNQKLSDREARAIILKGHGYSEGTRTSALKAISLKRAKLLIDATRKGGPEAVMAKNVISALGVHTRKGDRYSTAAVKLLADKLM